MTTTLLNPMPSAQRWLIKISPEWLRSRALLRMARTLVRSSYHAEKQVQAHAAVR